MTLDGVHRELQVEFNLIETEKLPALYKEKNDILVKLKNYKDTGVLNITKQIELNDRLYDIKKEISDNKRKIRDYYLNNSSYIFDYFENKKEITNGTNKTKKLNSFFKLENSVNENELNRVNENNVQKFFTNLDQRFFKLLLSQPSGSERPNPENPKKEPAKSAPGYIRLKPTKA